MHNLLGYSRLIRWLPCFNEEQLTREQEWLIKLIHFLNNDLKNFQQKRLIQRKKTQTPSFKEIRKEK